MKERDDFTSGRILVPLLRFAVPVLFALFLQATYGAVDLLIVGQFASSADVSAVSTGSQIMHTFTGLVSSFAVGITVFVGQKRGEGNAEESNRIIGAGSSRSIPGEGSGIIHNEQSIPGVTLCHRIGDTVLKCAADIAVHDLLLQNEKEMDTKYK